MIRKLNLPAADNPAPQSGKNQPSDAQPVEATAVPHDQQIQMVSGAGLPEEEENPDSIWSKKRFPSKTRPISFTPKQLKQALNEYSDCTTPLSDVLSKKRIERDTFYELIGLYPEISAEYSAARGRKAHKFGEVIEKAFDKLPEDERFYVYDKEGNKSLSSAGANYLKIKCDNMHRIAQIHETRSYVPVSKQEINQRTIGVQLTGKLPDNFDLVSASTGDLIDAIKGRLKRV